MSAGHGPHTVGDFIIEGCRPRRFTRDWIGCDAGLFLSLVGRFGKVEATQEPTTSIVNAVIGGSEKMSVLITKPNGRRPRTRPGDPDQIGFIVMIDVSNQQCAAALNRASKLEMIHTRVPVVHANAAVFARHVEFRLIDSAITIKISGDAAGTRGNKLLALGERRRRIRIRRKRRLSEQRDRQRDEKYKVKRSRRHVRFPNAINAPDKNFSRCIAWPLLIIVHTASIIGRRFDIQAGYLEVANN